VDLRELGSDGIQILSIIVLVILSGLVSGVEAALAALGPHGVADLLDDEKRRSGLLRLWRAAPERAMTSLRVAVTGLNLAAAALAALTAWPALASRGNAGAAIAVALAIGALTLLIVLVAEIVPRSLARRNPRLLLPMFPLVRVVCMLLTPVAWLLRVVAGPMLRGGEKPVLTEAELESMLRMSTEQGAIPAEKRELLSSIIEFSDTLTLEILVPRTDIVGFEVGASLDEVLETVRRHQFSRYPVYEEDLDSIVGLLTVKDLLAHLARPGKAFDLEEISRQHKLMFVPETRRIGDLLRDFQRERVQMAIAIDEFGGTAGIVTTEDVVEEIVGDIWDEHEKAEPPVKEIGDGRYVIQARVPIEELEDLFGIELPQQDIYETVGGLVMTHAGKVPMPGEVVQFAGLKFEVRERARTRVITLVVSPLPKAPDAGNDAD
jgi:CBS domain containing-hemolysin-like protein